MRIGRLLAVVVLAATVFTACGDDDERVETDQPTTSSGLSPTTTTTPPEPILLRDFSFFGLDVEAGTTVLVQNQGQEPHTLTAVDGRFDTGQVQPGTNVELSIPSRPGTYRIRCLVHPERMMGELKVT